MTRICLPNPAQATCVKCGKEFTYDTRRVGIGGVRKFCHEPCTSDNTHYKPSERNCLTCGKRMVLKGNSGGRRYCGDPCFSPSHKRKYDDESVYHTSMRQAQREAKEALEELQAWLAEERKHL